MAGEPAYEAELQDAYEWWMREKAEWWLENEANGGPVQLDAWANGAVARQPRPRRD